MTRATWRQAPISLPTGALVSVAPPGAGKTTVLRPALLRAGLLPAAIVCHDDVRASFGRHCTEHAALPESCSCHDTQVAARELELSDQLIGAGGTWLFEQTGCKLDRLRSVVERAHYGGQQAIALRRVDDTGDRDIPLSTCLYRNARRTRVVSHVEVRRLWSVYPQLTAERLYELGFDLVVEWNASTTFRLDSVSENEFVGS